MLTGGVTLEALTELAALIQLPASNETLTLSNSGFQNALVNWVTGSLQTNFNIFTSCAQIFALEAGGLPPTQSPGLCTLASQLSSVSTMTDEVHTLNKLLPQLVSVLRTYAL